jgi:antitoxin HicB
MDYPVMLERDDNDTVLVSFPDFPEAHTFGDDLDDALRHAIDALATAIDAYIKDRREIPLPSAIAARHRVTLPALVEAKVRLYETMREAGIRKSELARRLHWHPPQVDRLLEMTHESRLDQIERAFEVMGKRLVINVQDFAVQRRTPRTRSSKLSGHANPPRSKGGVTFMTLGPGERPPRRRRRRRRQ